MNLLTLELIMNFKKILENIKTFRERDDKHQKALQTYCETIAPSSYVPVIEHSFVQAYIEGVSQDDLSLHNWLSYWAWDFSTFTEPAYAKDGKFECLDCRDEKLFAEFLEKIFN